MNAIIIPIILTPVIGYFFIKVLFQLDSVSSQLWLLSNTDELTGVHNRRYFFEYMEHELSLARRYGQVFFILTISRRSMISMVILPAMPCCACLPKSASVSHVK